MQGIGNSVEIIADPLEILYNTVVSGRAAPVLRQIPTIMLVPGTLHTFALEGYLFGNIDDVTISSSASWIMLVVDAMTGNRTLRYAPPTNLVVNGMFNEYSVDVHVDSNMIRYSMTCYVYIEKTDTTPVNVLYFDIPENMITQGALRGATAVISVILSRALVAGETLVATDIELQGVTGVSVTGVTVDPTNDHKYDISLAIAQGAEGELTINIV